LPIAAESQKRIAGKALKGRRHNIILATKTHRPLGDDPNQRGNTGSSPREDSLHRSQTDHIDLYQIHQPSPDTDIEETLSALTDLM
jgi:aryl-alcohol dehydrogenase-like predicted oxidoreductase